jgi:NAD(P)-dependent dehydrogenase (short-subunit alcohol dehydrogenase family)
MTSTAVVTGGNSGIGFWCARTIATTGTDWHVVVAARPSAKTDDAIARLRELAGDRVHPVPLDLRSLASVREFARDLAGRALPPLAAVVCNAGVQSISGVTQTADGFEETFGVNHLGHFLLANLQLRQLEPPARVVFVASGTHDPAQRTGIPVPRYTSARELAQPTASTREGERTAGLRRYSTSKLCNVLCTYELARRLEADGVSTAERPITVNAYDPGAVPGTGLTRDWNPLVKRAIDAIGPLLLPLAGALGVHANSVERAGAALARLVLDPALERVTGKYFAGEKETRSSEESYDPGKAKELFDASAALVGLRPEETPLRSAAAPASA